MSHEFETFRALYQRDLQNAFFKEITAAVVPPMRKVTAKELSAFAGSTERVVHDEVLFMLPDFSVLEMKLMASQMRDPIYANPDKRSPDFYTWLTARDKNIPVSAVTQEMRRWTKEVCFGSMYSLKPPKWYTDALKEYEACFH